MEHYFDTFLFAVLPYVSIILFLIVTIQRYRTQAFTYSSLSSQFLENERHFWALVPFHYGILALFVGHLMAFLIPRQILAWNAEPLRLYALEVTGFLFAIVTLIGIINTIWRRHSFVRARVATTPVDWIVYAAILAQVLTGIYVALAYRWGSSWFAAVLSPYLWSLFKLNPDLSAVTQLPWPIKVHIVGAFLFVLLFPFTRLVHVLVVPNPYLWRKAQVVRWWWDRRKIRKTGM